MKSEETEKVKYPCFQNFERIQRNLRGTMTLTFHNSQTLAGCMRGSLSPKKLVLPLRGGLLSSRDLYKFCKHERALCSLRKLMLLSISSWNKFLIFCFLFAGQNDLIVSPLKKKLRSSESNKFVYIYVDIQHHFFYLQWHKWSTYCMGKVVNDHWTYISIIT